MKQIRSFFYFTKKERTAVGLLAFLTIALTGGIFALKYISRIQNSSPEIGVETPDTSTKNATSPTGLNTDFDTTAAFRTFDPNTVTREELQSMGITSKLATTWTNYTKRGGKIRKPEDLLKIYGMNEAIFRKMEPFMRIGYQNRDNFKATIPDRTHPELHSFDLNKVTLKELTNMGIDPYNARMIVGFREKVHPFKTVDELKKVYGMDDKLFNELAPFASIHSPPGAEKIIKNTPVEGRNGSGKTTVVEINSVDYETLKKIQAFGPFYGGKILRYRDALGGFIDINQISETYQLPDSIFQRIKPWITIIPSTKKININTADFLTLNKHPYIDSRQAGLIIKYREQNGLYATVADIEKIKAFGKDWIEKIKPYLSTE